MRNLLWLVLLTTGCTGTLKELGDSGVIVEPAGDDMDKPTEDSDGGSCPSFSADINSGLVMTCGAASACHGTGGAGAVNFPIGSVEMANYTAAVKEAAGGDSSKLITYLHGGDSHLGSDLSQTPVGLLLQAWVDCKSSALPK